MRIYVFRVFLIAATISPSLSAADDSAAKTTQPNAKSFVGRRALQMSNGEAGWLSIKRSEGKWATELWTVGEPKQVTNIVHEDGALTFVRRCRVGKRLPPLPPTPDLSEFEFGGFQPRAHG